MHTTLAGRFLALAMLAGLLTASLPIPAEADAAKMPPQAADQELAEACGSYANGTELDLFSAAPVPFTPGQLAAASGCPGRPCQPDATFTGCCNSHAISGVDSSGACSVHVRRCPPRD